MKVACIFPKSLFSAWSVSEGLCDVLKRMGHDVLQCGIDPYSKTISRKQYPSYEELESCDSVLVSGPEHIALDGWRGNDFVSALYPEYRKRIKGKLVAWLHETVKRQDYQSPMPIERIKKNFDIVYTPAAQDEDYGLRFLPFGVDTEMFQPFSWYDADQGLKYPAMRDIDVGFIGLMYGPRQEFHAKLQPLLGDVKVTIGNCQVQDLSGVNIRKSVELYASELRRCKVLLNLPSLCRHSVTKITEAMACGAVAVTEKLEDARNNFLRGVVTYRNEGECAGAIRYALENQESIAREGCKEVHANHRLEQRLEVILNN